MEARLFALHMVLSLTYSLFLNFLLCVVGMPCMEDANSQVDVGVNIIPEFHAFLLSGIQVSDVVVSEGELSDLTPVMHLIVVLPSSSPQIDPSLLHLV